jgi:hypothetical protein
MARKLTRDETRDKLNNWIESEHIDTGEWLADLRDELLANGSQDAIAAARLTRLINPKIPFRQLSRILDLGERMLVLEIRPLIDAAARESKKQSARAQGGRQMTEAQERKVKAFIDKLKATIGVRAASRQAAAHLQKGTLPGLPGVKSDFQPEGIRSIYYGL